jgi:uncharacterized protein
MQRDSNSEKTIIAVVADTHVPDRAVELHPGLVPKLQNLHPDMILHAGDISSPEVLEDLGRVSPVKVVRGNRDWYITPKILMHLELEINSIRLVLVHGHGGWGHYFVDKLDNSLRGYRLERYEQYLTHKFPQANVYIFGHSHFPENSRRKGRFFFNPGSACLGCAMDIPPSFGVIEIQPNGSVDLRIVPLTGFELKEKHWIVVNDEMDKEVDQFHFGS